MQSYIPMTRAHKIETWIVLTVAVLIAVTLALIYWQKQKAISLRGAVLMENADPRKQQPIAGVTISGGDLAVSDTTSNSTGFFVLKLRKPIRKGHPIVLSFHDLKYPPLEVRD